MISKNGIFQQFVIIMLFLFLIFFYLSSALEYEIKQGVNKTDGGQLYYYAPYILWNTDINPNPSPLISPFNIYSNNRLLDIELSVEEFRFSNELFSFTTRSFCFENKCSIPGPTLICNPGDRVKITLINNLKNTSGFLHIPDFSTAEIYPNRTNLYFQGLPIDPSVNDPFRATWGNGDKLVYDFTIPSDSNTGINWYHSRYPGVSSLHVMGGLFGSFQIEAPPSPVLHQLLKTRPQTIVLHHIMLDKTDQLIPDAQSKTFSLMDNYIQNGSVSFTFLSQAFGSSLPIQPEYKYNHTSPWPLKDAWVINGQYQPYYELTLFEWKQLDLLIASADRIIDLRLVHNDSSPVLSIECDYKLLAYDGLNYKDDRLGMDLNNAGLVLYQSSRASVLVRCKVPGLFYFETNATLNASLPGYHRGDDQTKSIQYLMSLNVTGPFVQDPNDTFSPSQFNETIPSFLQPTTNPNASLPSTYSWDLSTAQSGCCSCSQIVSPSLSGTTCTGSASNASLFWLGTGSDCQLPCYERLLCDALYPSGYSAYNFPTSLNGKCTYISESVYAMAHGETSVSPVQISPNSTQWITVYAHEDFLYPILIQGQKLELQLFEPPNPNISNILSTSEYKPNYSSYNFSVLNASQGEWRDSWPLLPGKNVFKTYIGSILGRLLIMTTFLKYEDLGLLSSLNVSIEAPSSIPSISGTPSLTPISASNPNIGQQPSSSPSIPPTLWTPTALRPNTLFYPEFINKTYDAIPLYFRNYVDASPSEYLCDVHGGSFFYNETIDPIRMVRLIQIMSCPNYKSLCIDTNCGGPNDTHIFQVYQEVSLPLYPYLLPFDRVQDVKCDSGMVGVALNGVGIYSVDDSSTKLCTNATYSTVNSQPMSDRRSGNYTRDLIGRTSCRIPGHYDGIEYCGDIVIEASAHFDNCGGYQDASGIYKYHMLPTCLLQQRSNELGTPLPIASKNMFPSSPQIGWALDGFPIYGPIGPKGIIMKPCGTPGAHSQLCLDVCNGFFGPIEGYDEYTYRYYFTTNVSLTTRQFLFPPPTQSYPYTIGCYRGCLYGNLHDCSTIAKGYVDSFIPKRLHGVQSIFNVSALNITEKASTNPSPPNATQSKNATIPPASSVFRGSVPLAIRDTLNGSFGIVRVDPLTSQTLTQYLPRSTKTDTYITGMTRDPLRNTIFFVSQSAIFSFNEDTKVSTNIISGLFQIRISGYNMGTERQDINFIKVKDSQCTSIVRYNSSYIECLVVINRLDFVFDFSSQDVVVSLNTGTTYGVSNVPASIYRTNSNRPVVSQIEFRNLTFRPYSVHFHSDPWDPSNPCLYWGNIAPGSYGFSIQRSFLDGTQVETVLSNIQKPYSIQTTSVLFDSNLSYVEDYNMTHPILSGRSECSNPPYQSTGSHGSTLLSADPYCVYRGHYLFFVDSNRGKFLKAPMLSIKYHQIHQYLMIPVLDVDLTSQLFVNRIVFQDKLGAPLENALPVIPLLMGVSEAQSFHVDSTMGFVYMSFLGGLVVRYDLPYLNRISTPQTLSMNISSPNVSTLESLVNETLVYPDNQQSSDYNIMARLPFKSIIDLNEVQNLVVSQANISQVLGQYSTPLFDASSVSSKPSSGGSRSSLDVDNYQAYGIDISTLIVGGRNTYSKLPPWIKVLAKTNIKSKFHGVCAFPSFSNSSEPWNQQRILVVDTNFQSLVALSDAGVNRQSNPSPSLAQKYSVFWPHQIYCDGISSSSSSSTMMATVYLSEYLGRIWKMQLQVNWIQGTVEFRDTLAPSLVVDKSQFPASIYVRGQLNAARLRGLESFDVISFDADF